MVHVLGKTAVQKSVGRDERPRRGDAARSYCDGNAQRVRFMGDRRDRRNGRDARGDTSANTIKIGYYGEGPSIHGSGNDRPHHGNSVVRRGIVSG